MKKLSSTRNDDMISSLHDVIIGHILSFLETKEAVATSVLSKRWTHLWHSVPVLNFENVELDNQEACYIFNEFVYSVLLSRNSIKSCLLKIWYEKSDLAYHCFPNFVKWINAMVHCKVESLDILYICPRVRDDYYYKLPISILSCKTLVVLKFFRFMVEGFSHIRLPSLKILHFEETNFLNVQDLLLLLAGCPILEELQARHLVFDTENSLTYQELQSLCLNKLIKADLAGTFCHFPLKALHNVEYLCIEINKVYRCFDDIPTFHNLTNLGLFSINCNSNLLVKLLKHCPNLQNVELEQGIRLEDVLENWVDPIFVPQCLSLQLKTCKINHEIGHESELLLERYILKNARVLQTMKIYCFKDHKIEEELSLCPKASPTCEVIIECYKF